MLEGYKTKIGLGVAIVVGIASAFGIVPDTAVVKSVETLALALVGYGIYDKVSRK